ncbi:metal-dependent transcriptional regulator [Streptomyces sp. NPDC052496]|uniref:metal-dependent transcriptional regulator n=1 Tax=Streptomyces sp. NPDC052496 TaxID=3154951 RepID=UPI003448DC03
MTTQGLVDPTEMYLRTIFELEEEGVVPLRARIAERVRQSRPTVSQTVARMQRDGLVRLASDRRLVMTGPGRRRAVRVMRKHRLAECLLADVIGLRWEDVHVEASRWQHVMSDAVESRLTEVLGHPAMCPHGSPIPTGEESGTEPAALRTLTDAATTEERPVVVVRIGELPQNDPLTLAHLKRAGIRPDRQVAVVATENGVRVTGESGAAVTGEDGRRGRGEGGTPGTGTGRATLPRELSDHIFVDIPDGAPQGEELR